MGIQRSLGLLDIRLGKLVPKILEDCKYHNLPFEVFETGRTLERQKALRKRGVTKTLKSKHLVTFDNTGILTRSKAVDFVLHYMHEGKMVWSWANIGDKAQRDRDMAYYKMFSALVTTKYPELLKKSLISSLISGGTWKTFKDYPHIEIR